jgi:hypothetical protein
LQAVVDNATTSAVADIIPTFDLLGPFAPVRRLRFQIFTSKCVGQKLGQLPTTRFIRANSLNNHVVTKFCQRLSASTTGSRRWRRMRHHHDPPETACTSRYGGTKRNAFSTVRQP